MLKETTFILNLMSRSTFFRKNIRIKLIVHDSTCTLLVMFAKRCLNAVTYVYEHSTIKLTNNS